jgi:Ca-activated chloride channel family protein
MKTALLRTALALILPLGAVTYVIAVRAQDGPNTQGSATVARPRPKPGAPATADTPDAPKVNTPDSNGELPKIPSKLSPKGTKDGSDAPDATFRADTNIVNIDVAVLDNKGNPIPNLTKDKFRILEDNVPQTVTQFEVGEAPMTIALVVEFSARFQAIYSQGWFETLQASYGFVQTLKPDDYLAVIAYDLRSDILSDFTNDRAKTQEALARLRVPGFSESNMFDALSDTADRMSKIEGRKAILLVSSGIDTFSKLTYDKARKSLQEAGVPIYSIGKMQTLRMMAEASGQLGAIGNLDFLQGDNELRTFAKETGGQAYFPRFLGEMPAIFQSISRSLRNQYSVGYAPNNQAKDGKFRKVTVQLVNPATNEALRMVDEKGKPFKYTVVAKNGYTAPRVVE